MAKRPVIFATDNSPEGIRDAKEYIRRFGLTREDVSLANTDGMALVYAKRDIRDKIAPREKRNTDT